ncbi:unnamed protein product [Pleuronectes platessa]|uniref:Uncharacterized protein n=1 Tax=Pleuronectes platessa TaxID=8262 RepID=A0A9N7Z6W5_PLEPL|nr:unnamed protein product [Pleuronectes platessa]
MCLLAQLPCLPPPFSLTVVWSFSFQESSTPLPPAVLYPDTDPGHIIRHLVPYVLQSENLIRVNRPITEVPHWRARKSTAALTPEKSGSSSTFLKSHRPVDAVSNIVKIPNNKVPVFHIADTQLTLHLMVVVMETGQCETSSIHPTASFWFWCCSPVSHPRLKREFLISHVPITEKIDQCTTSDCETGTT